MTVSLYREFYKFCHKKVTWIAPSIVVVLMVLMGLSAGQSQPRLMVMTGFGSSEGILLTLIIVASSIFSMEFQNHAILTILYKAPGKWHVYLAKLIVTFGYNVALHLLALLVTFGLSWTPIIKPVDWSAVYQHGQPLIINLIATTGVDVLTSSLIIGFIFLTSCLINSNAVVVTLNIAVVFMGAFISYNFLLQNQRLASVFRWNPFNMVNLTKQYYNASMVQSTYLNNVQLILGTIAYSFVLLIVGYLIFRKKRF